jgi:hypothetical protein
MDDRLYKLGGVSFVVSGVLFLAKSLLETLTGLPPPGGPELVTWVVSRQALLATTVEVFFFGVVFAIPATAALYQSLAGSHRRGAVIGCGIIATTIPVLFTLIIVQGRLVFPVFHIEVRSQHVVALLFVVATLVLSLAMRRRTYGPLILPLGLATAVFDLIGAYPWAIGLVLWLVSGMLFSAWFILVGLSLYRTSTAPA